MNTTNTLLRSITASFALAFISVAVAQEPAAPATAAPATAAPATATPEMPAAQEPAATGPVFVLIDTTKGNIVLELDPIKAPISVANFRRYVKEGFYNNTVFHRIVPNFVVQGGGFDEKFIQKKTNEPIKNEWTNGLKNNRGSISMARLPSPDSATSQFFLNLKDNPALDGGNGPGYAVFGKIVVGMDVLDAMGAIPPGPAEATDQTGTKRIFPDVPSVKVMMKTASEIDADTAAKMMAAAKAAVPAVPAVPVVPAAPVAPAAPAAPAAPVAPAAPAPE